MPLFSGRYIEGSHQPGLYILDTLFSIFVIGTLVVIAWRGVWGIMDLTFYPFDRKTSYWSSLILGYTIVLITFVIKPFIRCICNKNYGILRLITCDLFYFLIFFGAVNAWRGIWNLLDIYVYPDNKILSYWLTHVIPFLILAALKCSNSILVRGVFIDAEGTAEECVEIPISYVKLHFQRERYKKSIFMAHRNNAVKKIKKGAHTNLIEKSAKMDIRIHPGRDPARIV
ncbi:uncharacterized protein fusl isoform X3 [Eurosta solidaginis]|uniref:uncharacterized protein fusl isoform X3 n=1 Tax=Eurosta solidaginis TaxID=178769 RepID=UPI003530C7B4